MTLMALEIHDAGILAKREGQHEANQVGPGFAMVRDAELLTGDEARACARLKPRHVDNRFWSEPDTTPLPSPFGGGTTRADLAHAHLEAVWAKIGRGVDQAVLVLPGSYTDDQLGLILGIAGACGLPVRGLVDAAVAACPAKLPSSQLLHLDLQLHRAVVSELIPGSELSRREIKVAARAGLADLHDAWVHHVAGRFLRETRFDPLHGARTEQALYDAVPGLLRDLRDAERAEIALDAAGKRHVLELTRQELVAAVAEPLETVARTVGALERAGRSATVLLSHRSATLPGLADRLVGLGQTVTVALGRDAAVDGALRNRETLLGSDGSSFTFVTTLPLAARSAAHAAAPDRAPEITGIPDRKGVRPTHLLYEARAYPITSEPLVVGVAPAAGRRGVPLLGKVAGISREHCSLVVRDGRVLLEDRSRHGSFLNGQRVAGTVALVAGDRLRMGSPGIELLLLCVVDDDGAPAD